jgi:hypothetical protein
MRARLLSVVAITIGVLGMVVPVASAAATPQAPTHAVSVISESMTPADSVGFPGLSCEYGGRGSGSGWGQCQGTGTWTLHVGCNLSPVVLTEQITQDGGTSGAHLECWQGVNDVWLTSP